MSLNELKSLNERLSIAEVEYLNIRREYDKREFEIITTFDFKGEYGKDNEKIRNGHIKEVLSDLLLKKDALSLEIDSLKREIRYQELVIEYG